MQSSKKFPSGTFFFCKYRSDRPTMSYAKTLYNIFACRLPSRLPPNSSPASLPQTIVWAARRWEQLAYLQAGSWVSPWYSHLEMWAPRASQMTWGFNLVLYWGQIRLVGFLSAHKKQNTFSWKFAIPCPKTSMFWVLEAAFTFQFTTCCGRLKTHGFL